MKRFLLLFSLSVLLASCGEPVSPEPEPDPLPPPRSLGQFQNISLDSKASVQTVTLPRDVSTEGAIVKLKDGVSWLNGISLDKDKITFKVEENTNVSTGHRYDTILVIVRDVRIGAICVSQARPRKSPDKLQWALPGHTYSAADVPGASGKEKTKAIYNLEKTTNGADNYRNYPAFAYCIEMNHDPENDMEWYLPSDGDLPDLRYYKVFSDNYYWSAFSLSSGGYTSAKVFKYNAAGTSKKKTEQWGVYAFKDGSVE